MPTLFEKTNKSPYFDMGQKSPKPTLGESIIPRLAHTEVEKYFDSFSLLLDIWNKTHERSANTTQKEKSS